MPLAPPSLYGIGTAKLGARAVPRLDRSIVSVFYASVFGAFGACQFGLNTTYPTARFIAWRRSDPIEDTPNHNQSRDDGGQWYGTATPPSFLGEAANFLSHLETLKGNLKGWHSIRVNDQHRVIFRFSNGSATDVKIVDYH